MKLNKVRKAIKNPYLVYNYTLKSLFPNRELNKLKKQTYDYKQKIEHNKQHSKYSLYFDLCKRLLTDSINDKSITFENFNSLKDSEIKDLLKSKPTTTNLIGSDNILPRALTMIGLIRMENLQFCVENIIQDNIEGDLMECGVWRGGACVFMKLILDRYDVNKKIVLADSFGDGFPIRTNPYDKQYEIKDEVVFETPTIEQVTTNFKNYGVLDDNVIFVKGFFEESLKNTNIDSLSLLRADGDLYTSTWPILEHMYPKLSSNGHCIIDDYFWAPCKKAVTDYRNNMNVKEKLMPIDYASVFWQKL